MTASRDPSRRPVTSRRLPDNPHEMASEQSIIIQVLGGLAALILVGLLVLLTLYRLLDR